MPAHNKGDFNISKFSTDVRNALAKISADYITGTGAKSLKEDLDAMRPVDRAQTQERFLKFWLPTMGTVSVKGGADGDAPVEIKVTYSSPNKSDDEDEDANDKDYSVKINV